MSWKAVSQFRVYSCNCCRSIWHVHELAECR